MVKKILVITFVYASNVLIAQESLQMGDSIKPMPIMNSFTTTRVTGGGLQNTPAKAMRNIDSSFVQHLKKDLQDAISTTEEKAKKMNKQEILAALQAMQQELLNESFEFAYPLSMDQDSLQHIYQDIAVLKNQVLKKQAIQAILMKYALMQ